MSIVFTYANRISIAASVISVKTKDWSFKLGFVRIKFIQEFLFKISLVCWISNLAFVFNGPKNLLMTITRKWSPYKGVIMNFV